MSGFEIAGLVLGAFPILYDAAKDCRKVLGRAKSWWQFEATFMTFLNSIDTQMIAYGQVLQRLLEPTEVSDEDYDSLLRNDPPSLWHELHIQEALRNHLLPTEYQWLMRNLFNLQQDIATLQEQLPTGKVSPFAKGP